MKPYISLVCALGAALIAAHTVAGPIYKCTTDDGRTIFSSTGCGLEGGVVEQPNLNINSSGRLADQQAISDMREARNAAAQKNQRVGVVTDSRDAHTARGMVRQRLQAKEDQVNSVRKGNQVKVVTNSDQETLTQKERRLRSEAAGMAGR